MTKKELILKELKKIKDFDSIKSLKIFVKLKEGGSMEAYQPLRKSQKYTKEEIIFKKVANVLRNTKDEKVYTPSLHISNIKSLRIKPGY